MGDAVYIAADEGGKQQAFCTQNAHSFFPTYLRVILQVPLGGYLFSRCRTQICNAYVSNCGVIPPFLLYAHHNLTY